MPTPIVIDLSHHNTVPVSFLATKQAGIIGIIHKATEGLNYKDDTADGRWYMAKQAGLLWGLYHFMRPGNMKQQAAFFVNVAKQVGDENTLLCADHEDLGVSLSDLKVWLKEVERLTGRKPVIYSGHVLKQQLGNHADAEISSYLLWLAQYASHPTLPAGFTKEWLWQYTDRGTVPGVTPPTDLDAGDAADVRAKWSGAAVPIPGPAPEAPQVRIDITVPDGTMVLVSVNGHPV